MFKRTSDEMSASAFSRANVSEGTSGSMGAFRHYGLKFAPVSAAVVLGLASSTAKAQVIQTTTDPVAPPWNAQRIFDPSPLPTLTDPGNREPVAPEDTPVKTR